jgi:hypothetical protein
MSDVISRNLQAEDEDMMNADDGEEKRRVLATSNASQEIHKEDSSKSTRDERFMRLEEPTCIISEACSPPRVAPMAPTEGMREGFSTDLAEIHPGDGLPWESSI